MLGSILVWQADMYGLRLDRFELDLLWKQAGGQLWNGEGKEVLSTRRRELLQGPGRLYVV